MSVTIENCSDKVVTVRFNNQVSKHISPGQKLEDIASSLVAGNQLIKKLQERKLINMVSETGKSGADKKASVKAKPSDEPAKSTAATNKPAGK